MYLTQEEKKERDDIEFERFKIGYVEKECRCGAKCFIDPNDVDFGIFDNKNKKLSREAAIHRA